MKGRTRIFATKLAHASPVETVIQFGSSPRLLPQRSAVGKLGSASATVGVKGSPSQTATQNAGLVVLGLGPAALAQLEVFTDHRHTGNRLALAPSRIPAVLDMAVPAQDSIGPKAD